MIGIPIIAGDRYLIDELSNLIVKLLTLIFLFTTISDRSPIKSDRYTNQIRKEKMALERQIVDRETGEVKSRGSLGENSNFVMLFRNQMSALVELQKAEPKAGALFMFFMEHMDRENALIVSIKTISEILGWSEPTVYRQIKILKDKNLVSIAKSGTSNIYFINSQVAWTTYGNKKEYSKFNANVLISKSEQEYRIKANKFKQIDLKAL